jgi:hypothetical protein
MGKIFLSDRVQTGSSTHPDYYTVAIRGYITGIEGPKCEVYNFPQFGIEVKEGGLILHFTVYLQ